MQRLANLFAMAVAAGVCGVEILGSADQSLALLLSGILLVVVLPGYGLLAALSVNRPLDFAASTVAAISLGMSCTIVSGLLLHFTPWGLQRTSWALTLTGVTVAGCAIALAREFSRSPDQHNQWSPPLRISRGARRSSPFSVPVTIILLGLALGITSVSILVARYPVNAVGVRGYTLLATTPSVGRERVIIGVQSGELDRMTYSLEARSGRTLIRRWEPIVLVPGQRWEGTVDARAVAGATNVTFVLRRADHPGAVYRRVTTAVELRASGGA